MPEQLLRIDTLRRNFVRCTKRRLRHESTSSSDNFYVCVYEPDPNNLINWQNKNVKSVWSSLIFRLIVAMVELTHRHGRRNDRRKILK